MQSIYYRIVGPTDAHLAHEFFLLCCLSLFTIASMLSMYRYSFGTSGDWWVVGVTTLWLGRHFVVRLLCTSDGTSHSWMRHFLTKYITAGQYFDPPSGFNVTEAANLFSHLLTAVDTVSMWLQKIVYLGGRLILNIRSLVLSSTTTTTTAAATATTPAAVPNSSNAATNAQQQQQQQQHDQISSSARQILNKYWNSLPPSQLCVASVTIFMCLCGLYKLHSLTNTFTGINSYYYQPYDYGGGGASASMPNFPVTAGVNIKRNHPTSSSGSKQHLNINDLHSSSAAHAAVSAQLAQYVGTPFTLHHFVSGVAGKRANHNAKHSNSNNMGVGPFGFESPTMWHYFLCISLWGTIASIIVYGRLLLPIPDLASGRSIASRLAIITNTKSDIMSSSRQTKGTAGGGGGGKYKISTNHLNNDAYIPWAEQYKSINAENRLRLHCTVIVVRMIENVFVCLFLPQTPFGCRVTGHCESSSVLWGNDVFLREKTSSVKSSSMYDALPHDFLSNFTISLSIATVTALLLWAQALALDKSHLSFSIQKQSSSTYYTDVYGSNTSMVTSMMGSGGNDSVNSKSNSNNPSSFFHSSSGGTGGSHKRRNKGKGGSDSFTTNSNMMMSGISDNIHNNSINLSNADLYSRSMHDIFQYEMCHFSQSTVLVIITKIQILCIIFVSMVCAYRFLTSLNFLAVSVALFGNVLAAFAISGPTETSELEQLAEEIRAVVEVDDSNNNKGK